MKKKKCWFCQESKALSAFGRRKNGGTSDLCQECYKPMKARGIIHQLMKRGELVKPLVCEGGAAKRLTLSGASWRITPIMTALPM